MRETLLNTVPGIAAPTDADAEEVCRAVRCPVLVVHGERDEIVPYAIGARLAEWTGGTLVTVPDGGHGHADARPGAVHPARPRSSSSRWRAPRPRAAAGPRARSRRRRALFVSSAIGLGHALRDVAIADELRALHPDLEIDWLAQDPVTRLLADRGERVHPASRFLASESAHIETRGGRARPARLPGDPPDGRDPRGQLPRVPRRRRGRAARPGRRRRGLGDRPLPAREPRAQAHGVRLADRLRRLAADAGRRSARGGPDRRLQRRDGRADRPLPAAARPFDLRRRPRRPGDRPAGPRAADRARLDPGPLSPSPATSPGSTPVDRATRCGPSWAASPTSRSAW